MDSMLVLQNENEVNAWCNMVATMAPHKPMGECLADADTFIRGARSRLPSIMSAAARIIPPSKTN